MNPKVSNHLGEKYSGFEYVVDQVPEAGKICGQMPHLSID